MTYAGVKDTILGTTEVNTLLVKVCVLCCRLRDKTQSTFGHLPLLLVLGAP